MTITATLLKIDAEHLADGLQEARAKLDGVGGEMVLDFSSARRVDSKAIHALEELADLADAKAIRIVLRGVNVEIYKVLKLVNLAPRFCFMN